MIDDFGYERSNGMVVGFKQRGWKGVKGAGGWFRFTDDFLDLLVEMKCDRWCKMGAVGVSGAVLLGDESVERILSILDVKKSRNLLQFRSV